MLKIPYGNTYIEFNEGSANVLTSSIDKLRSSGSGSDIVRRAMLRPIDSPRLSELARGKKNCVIIISDHTRPVPSRDIIPNMLLELREGNPDIEVTLLVATGFHRPTSTAELAAETDLLIAEGFIEPHFFAGFSGGRKSVLPGICDKVTVLGNHCSKFIDSPFARTGILDNNPLHCDMLEAARLAKLAYIVNVVIDESKKTVAAFAGNYVTAHRTGCDFLLGYCRVKAQIADIVITSNGGAPLDQNLYQCVKGMTAAEASCRSGGTIIMCAECADGHGGEGFYKALRDCKSPAELYARQMATPQDKTAPDQWESQILARILMHHKVIVVSRPEMQKTIEDMKMQYAPNLDAALKAARYGSSKTLTVIPNGISVIIVNQ